MSRITMVSDCTVQSDTSRPPPSSPAAKRSSLPNAIGSWKRRGRGERRIARQHEPLPRQFPFDRLNHAPAEDRAPVRTDPSAEWGGQDERPGSGEPRSPSYPTCALFGVAPSDQPSQHDAAKSLQDARHPFTNASHSEFHFPLNQHSLAGRILRR